MKKLLMIIYLSIFTYGSNTEQFLEEIRQGFASIEHIEDSVKKLDDINDVKKKERIQKKLEKFFPIYVESENPLGIQRNINNKKKYPNIELQRFLHLMTLYINQHPERELSNILLEKTLISMNKRATDVSTLEYSLLALLYKSFLNSMVCQTGEQEFIIQTNPSIAIPLTHFLRKHKNDFIDDFRHVSNGIKEGMNEYKEVIGADKSEKYILDIKNHSFKEIDKMNNLVLNVYKNKNVKFDAFIEGYMTKSKKETVEAVRKLRQEIDLNEANPFIVEVFNHPKYYNDFISLSSKNILFTYLITLTPFDTIDSLMTGIEDKRLELLKTCQN